MSRVFVDIGLSLDGYLAGPNRRPGNPLGDGGTAIHNWLFETATFREMLGQAAGDPSPDDALVKAVFERAGAYVMGRRMFDEGEVGWPEVPPFHAPVFVLTHKAREPWVRPGGTTFHFVTDSIDSALSQATVAAAGTDVRISGGADTIRQYLRAGAIDDVTVHIAPVLLGAGLRFFDDLKPGVVELAQESVSSSAQCTHISYRIVH